MDVKIYHIPDQYAYVITYEKYENIKKLDYYWKIYSVLI